MSSTEVVHFVLAIVLALVLAPGAVPLLVLPLAGMPYRLSSARNFPGASSEPKVCYGAAPRPG